VASPALIPVYSGALAALGMERAMVVSGCEGLDELSISGPSEIATIGFGLPSHIVTPEDAGLPRHPAEALKGDDAAYNAAALRRLLMGERGAYRDAVLLNAAAALIVAGEADNWSQGVEEAAEAIDKGLAKALLDCWVAF
jgi:anthranilate phosphoribosyltransferase